MRFILGIDVGSQGAKGVLMTEDLEIAAHCYVEHDVSVPKPGWVEQDGESIWWGAVLEVVRRLFQGISISRDDVCCMGCSAVSSCVLAVDRNDRALHPAILYNDTRAGDSFQQEVADIVAANSCIAMRNPLSSQSIAPKILWLKHHRPNILYNMDKLFTATSYIVYRLTGNFILDYPQAALYEPLYNYDERDWDEKASQAFGMTRKKLPRLGNPTEIAGTLTKEAAQQTGLPVGLPVIVSTSDGLCEMISVTGYADNLLTLIYGSAGAMGTASHEAPVMRSLSVVPHPLRSDRHMILASTATAAILTNWFLKNFGWREKQQAAKRAVNPYELLSQKAENILPGSNGLILLPYFSGERTPINDLQARGVLFGLTLYHTKAHIYRALLEGVAYSFRHNLDIIKPYTRNVTDLIACGGGTKSRLWVQIVSDVTGEDQVVPMVSTGAEIGAAYLCGIATELIKNLDTVGLHTLRRARKVEAREEFHQLYTSYYNIYRELYSNTRSNMHALAKVNEQVQKNMSK
jgi:xylulokinase